MSLAQVVPIQVTLAPGASPLPQFGTSYIPEELTTAQYALFVAQSGGLATLKLVADGLTDTLTALGLTSADKAWEDWVQHFAGQRVPEFAYAGFKGVADQVHLQSVIISPDSGSTTRASVGTYALTDLQGGPYSHVSAGVVQVVTLSVTDAGGGFGAPGTYTVQDVDSNVYTYGSGGINLWTVTVDSADTGLYRVTVDSVDYDFTTVGGETIEQIRDGIFAQMQTAHPTWTGNTSGTDEITITGNAVGDTLTVTTNSGPSADMSLVETTPIVPETTAAIATAIAAAITGATSPPALWTAAAAVADVVITANDAGVDLEIASNGPAAPDLTQVLTTDHRDLVSAVRDALDTLLDAASHPEFTNGVSGTDTLTITGATAGVPVIFSASAPNNNIAILQTQGVLTLRTAQVSRITIIENPADSMAFDGEYKITLFGTTVSYVASAETVTSVRDALKVLIDANVSEVSTADVGGTAFDMTGVTAGLPFTVAVTSPNSNGAMTHTVSVAGRSINDDIDRALTEQDDWYIVINTGSDVDIQVATDHIDDIGASTPRMHFWQSSTDAMKDLPIAGATDVGAITKATLTRRSKGAWHPVPAAATKAYEGAVSQWVGMYTTLLPGQIQPTNKRILGLVAREKLTATQETNLVDRAVERFEFVGSIGPAGASISQRRFTPSGRLIDIQRAIDQIADLYRRLAVDLITGNDILPYTNPGLAQIHAGVVVKGTKLLQDQGLVVGNYQYVAGRLPKVSDATDADRQAGITPLFNFNITIQLGITEIPIQIQIFQ